MGMGPAWMAGRAWTQVKLWLRRGQSRSREGGDLTGPGRRGVWGQTEVCRDTAEQEAAGQERRRLYPVTSLLALHTPPT